MKNLLVIIFFSFLISILTSGGYIRLKTVEVKDRVDGKVVWTTDSAKKVFLRNDTMFVILLNNKVKKIPNAEYIVNYNTNHKVIEEK